MSAPRVSIGVPVFNGAKYLREALESILVQDFQDFEVIVSDNASTDGTADICSAFARVDSRVRYYRNDANIGASPNYNRTFQLARGEYFKWCAHDDRCDRAFLTKCVAALEAAPPQVVLVYPWCDIIGESGEVLQRAPDQMIVRATTAHQRLAYVIRHVGWAYSLWGLIRSDHLRKTRLMCEGALNDYVLLAELSLHGKFLEVPEVLFQLRWHRGNAWAISSAGQGTEAWLYNQRATRESRRNLRAWTDPRYANKRVWLPFYEDLYVRYLKGVHHAGLAPLEKALCYGTVPAVGYWRRFHNFAALWKRRLLQSWHRSRATVT